MPNHNMTSTEEVSNCGLFGAKYTIIFETTDFEEYIEVKDLCEEIIKEREEGSNVNNK